MLTSLLIHTVDSVETLLTDATQDPSIFTSLRFHINSVGAPSNCCHAGPIDIDASSVSHWLCWSTVEPLPAIAGPIAVKAVMLLRLLVHMDR